jgi:hypothetical protein
MLNDLTSFSTPKNFSFKNLSDYKFGGIYIIFSIDKNGDKEIVKIGESNFIFRRIANYLTPLDEKDKSNSKKITKRTIQENLIKGEDNGLTYQICWKIEEKTKIRKQLEKDLISEFIRLNGKRPIMNRNNR